MSLSSRTTPLGLKMADASTGQVIPGLRAWCWSQRLDGLRGSNLSAARAQEPGAVREASVGMNGALVWHNLPGFGIWSAGGLAAGAPDPWDPFYQVAHSILMMDPGAQYLPARLLPLVPSRDLLRWTWGAGDVRTAVRCYRSSTAPTPDGMASIRSTLWDPERDTPAAWALLMINANGHFYEGLAGEDGQVVVHLPFPRPRPGLSLNGQSWPLTVSVRYQRLVDLRAPSPPLLGFSLSGMPRADMPVLDVVEAQTPGAVFAQWTSATVNTPFVPPPLTASGELYLASDPSLPGIQSTRLFVTP